MTHSRHRMRAAHVCLWAAATCGRQAGAFINGIHARCFNDGPLLPTRTPAGARKRVGVIPPGTATCISAPQHPSPRPSSSSHSQPSPRPSSSSLSRLRALPEDTDVEGTASKIPSTASSASDAAETKGEGGRKSRGTSTGKDQFISKLARRLADSFPFLTADEIKNEVRMLLNPETKGEMSKVGKGARRCEGSTERRCHPPVRNSV